MGEEAEYLSSNDNYYFDQYTYEVSKRYNTNKAKARRMNMEIRTFDYVKDGKVTKRELIVTEESATHLGGYDISKLDADEKKQVWRDMCKDLDMSKKTEEEAASEYKKFKEGMLAFRNFKKSQIQ